MEHAIRNAVAAAYTEDSQWRNRTEFLSGRAEIVEFLRRKWRRELDYKLKKELWGFRNNRMGVKFEYEWHDDSGNWFRSYGNELWEFAESGLMQRREASINDLPRLRKRSGSYSGVLNTPVLGGRQCFDGFFHRIEHCVGAGISQREAQDACGCELRAFLVGDELHELRRIDFRAGVKLDVQGAASAIDGFDARALGGGF